MSTKPPPTLLFDAPMPSWGWGETKGPYIP
jgi:hypothetical protein